MIIIEFELMFHLLLIKLVTTIFLLYFFILFRHIICTTTAMPDTLREFYLIRRPLILCGTYFQSFLTRYSTKRLISFFRTTERLTLLHFLPFLRHGTFIRFSPGIKIFFSLLRRFWNAGNSTFVLSIISDAVFNQTPDLLFRHQQCTINH